MKITRGSQDVQHIATQLDGRARLRLRYGYNIILTPEETKELIMHLSNALKDNNYRQEIDYKSTPY
jgi:hypothetical protein